MQVFERGGWVAAQVQQQADSYAQTLACSLLAAGRRPPDWLLPSRPDEPQGVCLLPFRFRFRLWVGAIGLGCGVWGGSDWIGRLGAGFDSDRAWIV